MPMPLFDKILIILWFIIILLAFYFVPAHGYTRADYALEIHRASTHCENIEYGYAHNNLHYILQECEYTTPYSSTTIQKAMLLNLDTLERRRIKGWKF